MALCIVVAVRSAFAGRARFAIGALASHGWVGFRGGVTEVVWHTITRGTNAARGRFTIGGASASVGGSGVVVGTVAVTRTSGGLRIVGAEARRSREEGGDVAVHRWHTVALLANAVDVRIEVGRASTI